MIRAAFFWSLIGLLGLFESPLTWALDFDTDFPATLKTQIQTDLDFMFNIQGSRETALHREVFGKLGGGTYQSFFETRVLSVGIKDCGGNNAVACVIPYLAANKMWISPVYTRFSHPQIARLMVLFHEARHTENKEWNWSHAKCPTPFLDEQGHEVVSIWSGTRLAGEPACDVSYQGSYGISIILLKNLAKFCSSCTDKVKMDAQMYGTDHLARIINASAKNAILNDSF